MSTVTGYYQLSNLPSNTSGSSSAFTPAGSLNNSLAQILSGNSGRSGNSGSSYLLDLSPAAQNILGSSSGSGASSSFDLSATQKAAIQTILAKYKDAPQDQATFDAIQADLKAAGLSPQELAAQDQITSFNPTHTLLSALNGDYGTVKNRDDISSGTQQSKINAYLQDIVSSWKTESSSSSGSASS